MTHFWGKFDVVVVHFEFWLLFPIRSYLTGHFVMLEIGACVVFEIVLKCIPPSLLLRVRFARFTNVFSLAVEDIVSLLGGVVFATLVGLGTSSLG